MQRAEHASLKIEENQQPVAEGNVELTSLGQELMNVCAFKIASKYNQKCITDAITRSEPAISNKSTLINRRADR